MKYKVTLNNRVYEVEVEAGQAMLVDEYPPPLLLLLPLPLPPLLLLLPLLPLPLLSPAPVSL